MTRFVLLFAGISLFASSAFADPVPETAADCFTKAEALLRQGDFDGAIEQYIAAVSAEPGNEAYVARARLVGRVISTRKATESDEITPHWDRMVGSLHVFYVENGILGEAEKLDRRAFRLLPGAASASRLAETLLELGKDAEAVSLIGGLAPEQQTAGNLTWLGIGLARLGKKEEAAKVAERAVPAEGAAPWDLFHSARLAALLAREAEAAALISRCLSVAPASLAATIRARAAACPDFSGVRQSEAFAKALKTAPRPESPCSGGAGCGTCPSRPGCGK